MKFSCSLVYNVQEELIKALLAKPFKMPKPNHNGESYRETSTNENQSGLTQNEMWEIV